METAVKKSKIKEILVAAKAQFINVAVSSGTGLWSSEYYSILDIQVTRTRTGKMVMLVLGSNRNSECRVLDVDLIRGIKFDKLLSWNEVLTDEVTFISSDVVHTSH